MTAEEKQKVFKQWQGFLQFLSSKEWGEWNKKQGGSDYGMEAPKVFTKQLYNHLSLHCGYIAHYNIHGFYSEYFGGGENDLQRFFRNFEGGYSSACCWGDYEDIGRAMIDEFAKYEQALFAKTEEATDEKWQLVKECVKRAESDLAFRKQVIAKFVG